MPLHFTKQQIDEIEQALTNRSKKDTSFPVADAITGEELVPIVQDNKNKTASYGVLAGKIISDTHSEIDPVLAQKADKSTVDALAGVVAGKYTKPSSGIPKTDLESGVQASLDKADNADALIPAQASASNQLADKNFVNSSIQTNTATFRGNWENWVSVPIDSVDATSAWGESATNNDYLVVRDASDYFPEWTAGTSNPNSYAVGDCAYEYDAENGILALYKCKLAVDYNIDSPLPPSMDDTHWENAATEESNPDYEGTWRFKYSPAHSDYYMFDWHPEYQVNEKPLTAAQLAALNSEITAEKVEKLNGIETGAQKNVKSDWNAASGDAEILNKPDLSQFVTRSVNDLVNYYLKSETYTKAEVQALIGAIQQFHYEVYPTLADVASPASNVLYLIGPTGTGTDKYKEYVYDSTKQEPWILIGDTSIDLSGYVTTQALNTALADYTTTADLTTLLAGKQDTISDLDAIRSGAAAGATAYQKPSGGIPASDMASGVQTSLGKADTAEQTSNKVTSLSNANTDIQYPSAKAVYDSFYKRGVISQTQTWTQAADGGYDYAMSNIVQGNIPRANIDLYEAAGATFNATTGYFELNGLTDISYEEMQKIYNYQQGVSIRNMEKAFQRATIRTNFNVVGVKLPITSDSLISPNITNGFIESNMEAIIMYERNYSPNVSSLFYASKYLKRIVNPFMAASMTSAAFLAVSLESLQLKEVKGNVTFYSCPRLTLDSILYMINNEAATSAITITLHATAYARAIADTDVQAALQNHPLVTLASA